MKKKLTIFSFLLLLTSLLHAQRFTDVGLSIGATDYFGDLGNEKLFPINNTHYGVALTFRNFLNNPQKSRTLYKPLSAEVRVSWQRIGYEETNPIDGKSGLELPNYGRGLGFRNDLFGGSAQVTYTFYTNKYKPLYKQGFCPFLMAGAGVFYGKPMADLFRSGIININDRYYFWTDGTVRDAAQSTGHGNIIQRSGIYDVNLRDWFTEGQGYNSEIGQQKPYSYTNLAFPVGIGIRKGITEAITLSVEVDYYYFMTDYLDDASNSYATYAQIAANFPNDPVKQSLAKYISDPTGLGTNGTPGPATSPRGNPKKNDGYSFISMEFAYTLQIKKKSFWNQ